MQKKRKRTKLVNNLNTVSQEWQIIEKRLSVRCSEVFADASWSAVQPEVDIETAVALIARCQPNESARLFVLWEVWCLLEDEINNGNIPLLETGQVRLRDCIDNPAVFNRYKFPPLRRVLQEREALDKVNAKLKNRRNAVLKIIPFDDEGRNGLTGTQILDALSQQGHDNLDQSYLTSKILTRQFCEVHGIYNDHDGVGYLRKR